MFIYDNVHVQIQICDKAKRIMPGEYFKTVFKTKKEKKAKFIII